MIDFEIKELVKNLKTIKVSTARFAFEKNTNFLDLDGIEIDDSIFLNKLYGKNERESVAIQKQNCKQVLRVYRNLVRAIKQLKHKKCANFSKIYTKNLQNKANHNDILICALLKIKFNYRPLMRLSAAYFLTCDFLDAENKMHNMCDFKDNVCINYRSVDSNRKIGCCPSRCKFANKGPCPHKNLSCKIFMCKTLKGKGFLFSIHHIPTIRKHMTRIERNMLMGFIFMSSKKSLTLLWTVRVFSIFIALVLLLSAAAVTVTMLV